MRDDATDSSLQRKPSQSTSTCRCDFADCDCDIRLPETDATAQQHADQQFSSERRLNEVLHILKGWIWETDDSLRFTYMSDTVRDYADKDPEWHYGKTRAEVGTVDPDSPEWKRIVAQHEARLPFDAYDFKRDQNDGEIWMRTTGRPIFSGDGTFLGYRGLAFDITAEKQAELARSRHEKLVNTMLEHFPLGITVKDAHNFAYVFVNHAFEKIMNASRDDILGKTAADIYDPSTAEQVMRADFATMTGDKVVATVEIDGTSTGVLRKIRTTRMLVRDSDGKPLHLIATVEDVTDRSAAQQRLTYLANHDQLTGLLNRTAFLPRLEHECRVIDPARAPVALFIIDLDRFKLINDTFGHDQGDELLTAFAARLSRFVEPEDMVARLGGDEFAVVPAHRPANCEDAGAFADQLINLLKRPFQFGERKIEIAATIGIAIATPDCNSGDKLLKNADVALYQGKQDGRSCYRYFDAELGRQVSERAALEQELKVALADDQLTVHYQPIVDCTSNAICCAEALVRWQHPSRGLLMPGSFIAIAEATGLVEDLGQAVLERACRQAAQWPTNVSVSVNVSPVQIRNANFAAFVERVLSENRLDPARLQLEVTETALIDDIDQAVDRLKELKALGVAIALDDFGTGYSALTHLTMFPFDRIKIDRSFVKDIGLRKDCDAVIDAVIGLARRLGVSITAEGVETENQKVALQNAGVVEMQGYLFSKPCPADALRFTAVSVPG
ncbi:MAG: EAL domain-containing protein [Pseudomonadota bacterium]